MKNRSLIRFVSSLILLPAMSTPVSISGVRGEGALQNALIQKQYIEAPAFLSFNQEDKLEALAKKEAEKKIAQKAEAIDAYFEKRGMPLSGTGMKMVEEAEKNEIDWRLLPAIAIRESTGGKFACKKATYNSFGWGSCTIGFDSNEEAIETIARNLGGNEPKTKHHYAEKNTKQILQKYNPPSVVPLYSNQVMSIMDAIGEPDLGALVILVSN